MRHLTVIAVLTLLPGAAPITPNEPIESLWEKLGRGPRPEKGYVDVLDDHLGPSLWESAHARRPLSTSIQGVAKEFRIEPQTAAALVEATILTRFLPDDDPSPALVDRAASAFWRAYRAAPASEIVLQQAGWILYELGHDEAQEPRVREEIARSSDPAPFAARLASTGLCSEETRQAAIATALQKRPTDPALLLITGALQERDPCLAAAWEREALDAAAAAGVRDPAFLATARNRLLSDLLKAGMMREAIEALRAIPDRERGAAIDADLDRAEGRLAGIEYEIPTTPVRSALAAAAFLIDEADLARSLAARRGLPPPEGEQIDLVRAAIERLTSDAPSDPFDLLDRAIVARDSIDARLLEPTSRLFAKLADAFGYPEIAKELSTTFPRGEEPPGDVPPRMAAAVSACRASMDESQRDAPDRSPDTPSSLVARRLAARPLDVFAEHPLPAGVVPREDKERVEKLDSWNIPHLWPVRVEPSGDDVIAIGLSQDYDPGGEVSGGGYWIVRSRDGGRTWGRRLYTGLRPMQPYVIRSVSDLPLSAGDRLRIEVDLRELDTDRIMFPPIQRSFKRERSGLFLEAAWADLEKDGDGDGLTDLAEERLMTDPGSADTDGDSVPDGSDPLPHVPVSRAASGRAGALAAVLRSAGDDAASAIFPGDPGGQGSAAPSLEEMMALMSITPSLTSEATMFIEGDPEDFAGVSPGVRTIILSPSEAKLAQERFGAHYPGELRLFVDHAGTRALAIWSERWRGMTIRLKNDGGTWIATVIGSWIT